MRVAGARGSQAADSKIGDKFGHLDTNITPLHVSKPLEHSSALDAMRHTLNRSVYSELLNIAQLNSTTTSVQSRIDCLLYLAVLGCC